MSRKKAFHKITAMLLSAIMVVGMTPASALAQDFETNEEQTAVLMAEDDLLGNPAASFVLKGLAAGALGSIGGYGMDKALEAIFGKEADPVAQAFSELKGEIGKIQSQIAELSGKLDAGELRNNLNNYGTFINSYSVVYDKFCISQKDYANDSEQTEILLSKLYSGTDLNYMVEGKSVIHATIALGNRLTTPFAGSNYNVFGAFDNLDKFTNRWEHQGYEQRKAFRDSAVYTYAMFSAMSQLACQKAIESNPGDDAMSKNIRIEASGWLKLLQANAAKVDEMNTRCAVKEHPLLRIYRDIKQGKDLYYFHIQVADGYVYSDAELVKRYTNWEKLGSYNFLWPITHVSSFRCEDEWGYYTRYSNQPSVAMYQKIYQDYNDGKGKAVGLYDIFFSKDNGAFYPPSAEKDRTKFATHAYDYIFGRTAGHWQTKLMEDNGQPKDTLLAHMGWFSSSEIYIYFRFSEKFYSPMYYYGSVEQGKLASPPEEEPSPEPADKITGMEEYYALPHDDAVVLTVEEKEDYTCQWHVDTGDGSGYQEIPGATGTSYTLPTLSLEMNGYQYVCVFTSEDFEEWVPDPDGGEEQTPPEDWWEKRTATAHVTLHLVGEGVAVPETEHTVSNAEELETALARVDEGEWDGHTLRLTDNIEYSRPITLIDRTLTIDTNGYTLTVNPSADSAPNVDPMSGAPEIAAVYAGNDSMLTLTGGGLNVQAGPGVAYGVYAASGSSAQAGSVTSTGGKAAVYALGSGSSVSVSGTVSAEGEDAVGVKCADGGMIDVEGNVTVAGTHSCGAHIASSNGISSEIEIGGDIAVSGAGSRGAYLDSEDAKLTVSGSVTVTGGKSGISAGRGEADIQGSVSAPETAINAWDGAAVSVLGNAASSGKDAVAISSTGAKIDIKGSVTVSGSGGTGIVATAWDLTDPTMGAQVTVDGIISAAIPLRIENLPIEESDYAEPSSKLDYRTYTDGTSTVWAKSDSFEIPVFYTLTVNANGGTANGSGQYTSGAEVSIDAGSRSGYSFTGWHSDNGGSFADSSSSVTTFTMPAGDVTVTAGWAYIGGDSTGSDSSSGGSSSTTTTPEKKPDQPVTATAPVTATTGTNGTASATIPDKAITDAIAKAQADARAQGRTANGISVELDVTMPQGATSLTATLTQNALNSLVSAGVSQLELDGTPVSLGLDLNALKEIQKQSSGNISITIAPATGLSKEAKALLGNRPVYSVTISYVDKNGKAQAITSLGNGTATLSIPYTPGKNEAIGYLFGVYVDANGKAQRIDGSAYDANSGSLLIPTGHFSVYGVGYTAPSAKFTDIGTHWGKEAIDYVVGRGLLSGTSETTFAPNTAMTRGMLVTALGRLASVDVKAYPTNSFTDVKMDSTFRPYIEWAYKNGVVQGIGNKQFAPDRAITREEIAVIFANYAKATGYKLPVTREATAYADASSIGSVYQTAVTAMQQAGIMMGGTGNKFNPKASATRAEVSSMLHRYIKLTIDPTTAQGWALNDAGQYLYYKDGKALTGTQIIDSVKYFFETTGVLKTGWVKDGDNWRYYSSNKAAMGWLDISDKRYCFTKDGLMVSGKWLEIDGKWYYFYADGALAKSTKVDGYEVDENGVRKTK
ncbi:MAG: S-layer homology domain-containing protein [Clostridiales bacterium]